MNHRYLFSRILQHVLDLAVYPRYMLRCFSESGSQITSLYLELFFFPLRFYIILRVRKKIRKERFLLKNANNPFLLATCLQEFQAEMG